MGRGPGATWGTAVLIATGLALWAVAAVRRR